MKLIVVDRRTRAVTMPLESRQLAALVRPLGRPEWELNLVLVSDREMAALNARWYGGEGTTDVLSFSYLEPAGEGPPALAAAAGEAACDLWVAPADVPAAVTAGEVVLAPAYVARRARTAGWDLATEWALLLVHGALHVLGWRHDTAEQRRSMREREAAALQRAGFAHPLAQEMGEA